MRVVICGAGITGLALANRLSALGSEVVLLERASGPRPQGYMIDFFGPGYDAVEAMGLMPEVEAAAYRIAEASLLDERGRRRTGVQVTRFASDGRLLSVMRPDLERSLVPARNSAAALAAPHHGAPDSAARDQPIRDQRPDRKTHQPHPRGPWVPVTVDLGLPARARATPVAITATWLGMWGNRPAKLPSAASIRSGSSPTEFAHRHSALNKSAALSRWP